MKREDCKIGMTVKFGRTRGEQTLGEVVKMNPKKAKVRILEDRGSRSKAGEVWGVPYSLMRPVAVTPAVAAKKPLAAVAAAKVSVSPAVDAEIAVQNHLYSLACSADRPLNELLRAAFELGRELESKGTLGGEAV